MNTDDYFMMEVERERLDKLAEDRIAKGLPLNDDIVLAQSKVVDKLMNEIMAAKKNDE